MATAMTGASLQSAVQPVTVSRSARQQRVNPAPAHARNQRLSNFSAPLQRAETALVPKRQVACAAVDGRAVRPDTNNKPKGAAKPPPPERRNCKIYSTEGTNTNLELMLSFIGDNGYEVGAPVDLSTFVCVPWREEGESEATGVVYEGEIQVPQDAKEELVMLRMKSGAKAEKEYINKIEIVARDYKCHVCPNSWVHKNQGSRLFFADGLSYLPQDTPADLQEWREAALAEIRGSKIDAATRREAWHRIYDYDVYNDLAGVKSDGTVQDRNILGGAEHPYPRRMRTGRARVDGAPIDPNDPLGPKKIYETRTTDSGKFWVPLDEAFNTTKSTNFQTYALLSAIPTTTEALKRKLFDSDKQLSSFKEVDSMYAKLADPKLDLSASEVVDAMKTPEGRMKDRDLKFFGINPDDIKLQLPLLSAISSSINSIKGMVGGIKGLLGFPPPLVVKNRPGVWAKDEEWGRQALAGVNPSSIKAVTSLDQINSKIERAYLDEGLEGNKLENLIAQGKTDPRLLVINHIAVFEDYAKKISEQKDRFGYSGQAVLYRRNDGQWVPIAIMLKGSDNETGVYTSKDTPSYWLLAKGVFSSLDSGFHQLVTHWLRTHACTEPYIIATHRQLSVLHPVYKLMVPHWAFTMQINANARSSLINADGIIETTFTPGRWALEMSSAVYGALWRFDKEALPEDLISRGLATRDESGKFKMLLKDYPYGDDGMLLWDAVEKWVGKYLALYYDDNKAGKKVSEDAELKAWWEEIQVKGHPDKQEGWPELNTVGDLTNILTTMIWIVSGHHAAINFSQYGYTGYILNRPNICRKKMPTRTSKTFMDMVQNPAVGEKVYLDTLNDQGSIRSVLTVELLSTHADNEVYMGDPNHAYILDPKALALYKEFAAEVRNIENIIQARNKDPKLKMRTLPYEFLAPSSPPGITNRGVPQSISI